MTTRTATVSRATRETSITVTLTLDGTGKADVKTGLGFLDHLLEALSRHARFDVTLACEGDLHVDDHHTAEDCALALGQALDRACRAFLEPGRTILLPDPSFDMFDCSATLAGGELVRVPWWDDAFPSDAFVGRLDARTGVVAVVSPNNPTGSVATLADVRRLAAAAPNALVILDHVYVEYADVDLTPAVLDLPNVLVLRTLSKAWGLAARGVLVRDFPDRRGLETALRITLPGNALDFDRLRETLGRTLAAEGLQP